MLKLFQEKNLAKTRKNERMRTCGRMVTKRRTLALTQTCPHRPIDCWGSHRSLRAQSPLFLRTHCDHTATHNVITQWHTLSHLQLFVAQTHLIIMMIMGNRDCLFLLNVMFLNSNALVTIKDHVQILPTHMHIMRRIFYVVNINISIMQYFLRQHLFMFEATYH